MVAFAGRGSGELLAIQKAAAVAALLFTTEAMVAEVSKKNAGASGMPQGGGWVFLSPSRLLLDHRKGLALTGPFGIGYVSRLTVVAARRRSSQAITRSPALGWPYFRRVCIGCRVEMTPSAEDEQRRRRHPRPNWFGARSDQLYIPASFAQIALENHIASLRVPRCLHEQARLGLFRSGWLYRSLKISRYQSIMERREVPRNAVLMSGAIEFAGGTISCLIRNISILGASLDVTNPSDIPERFNLVFRADRAHIPCHIIWRQEKRIGVAFD
jgi:PilZ domain